jgi:hypothetical protein
MKGRMLPRVDREYRRGIFREAILEKGVSHGRAE